jgi:hypothetical protein
MQEDMIRMQIPTHGVAGLKLSTRARLPHLLFVFTSELTQQTRLRKKALAQKSVRADQPWA